MKRLSSVAMIATLISANAFAGDHTINAVGRSGWIYNDNDVEKTGASNSSSFNIDYLKMTFAGVISPSVKYFLTTDMLATNTSTDAVDRTSGFIDEAFVTKTFFQGTSFTLGKKAVLIGGREYDYVDYDLYSKSSFKAATPSNQVGLTVAHEIAQQTFMAQYFNGNKNNGKGATTNAQSKFGYSIGWYGSIQNGLIKPILAYTVLPKTKGDSLSDSTTSLIGSSSTTRANSGRDAYLAGGVQVNLPTGLTIEADYDLLTQKDAEFVLSSKKDVKVNSIVGLVRYSTDRFAPFAKFITETRKSDSIKTAERTAYDIGLEFKESKEDAIRYHAVYSGSKLKTNMNVAEVKSSPASIMVGIKFDAAILK
ncbi:MAG: porin [Bacteriovorax sp.]